MQSITENVEHDALKKLLRYSKSSGIFTWLVTRSRTTKGSEAGSLGVWGYVNICIDKKQYRANRLAWFYVTGEWPVELIDHKNGVKHDNRWRNLRAATHSINNQNIRAALKTNKSGFLGVRIRPNGFSSQIYFCGKTVQLGRFKTAQKAHAAYVSAKRKYHEGCTL